MLNLLLVLLQSGLEAEYQFTIADSALAEVEAELKLTGLAQSDGVITLTMPQGFAFARLPEPRLGGEVELVTPFAGIDADGRAVPLESDSPATLKRLSPYRWQLDPGENDQLRLRWTVPLDHRSHPEVAGRDEYEYPYLRSDHGMLVMGTLAVYADNFDPDAIRVRFHVPEDWPIYAPWPQLEDGSFAPGGVGQLTDDLIAIGNWNVHQEKVRGMNLTLAFSPQQEFLREEVVQRVAPIVEAELELFGCTPQPEYLFLFGEPQAGGAGGSPKSASMTLFVDPKIPADYATSMVSHLIAHEFHHTWMRARCQPHDELRFVIEGFTDYFAYLVPWRLGQASDEKILQTLRGKFFEAEKAMESLGMTLQDAGGDAFFQGRDAYNAVYAGGLLMALWMDLGLRQAGTSCEQLLRDFYEDPRWHDGTRPSATDFWQLVAKLGGEKMAEVGKELATTKGFDQWQAAFARYGVVVNRSDQGRYSLHPSILPQLGTMPLDLAAPPRAANSLRVMQFNIWQEGTSVEDGFDKIADVIAASDADLIALSEVRNYNDQDLHQRLIEALRQRGLTYYAHYAGGDVGLLSRWPIQKAEPVADETASDHGSVMAFHIQHPAGKLIVCSAHLDYLNYATYLPRGYDGNNFKMIDPDGDGNPNPVTDLKTIHAMDAASQRDESIQSFLRYAAKHKKHDVILIGDFNECSHLDWTAATKDLYDHNGVVIEWQNSKSLEKAGFVDSWRALYPNPVTHPGATWPSPAFGRGPTTWTPKADERDRIDFVYSNQRRIKPTNAWIVGPQSYWLTDREQPCTTSDPFALTDHPWPSDHKGILVDFKWNKKTP